MPPPLWRHLGEQLGVTAPDLASLKGLYRRHRTLFEHQDLACEVLGFRSLTEAQRRALIRALRQEVTHTSDRGRLLTFARRWLYDHKLLVARDRDLRAVIVAACEIFELLSFFFFTAS